MPASSPLAIPVLDTKLFTPRLPHGIVSRPGLIDRIAQGVDGRLTIVIAPAGSGKTTLLAEWLAQRTADDVAVAWVSLDASDNEPASFWTCVLLALQRIHSALGQTLLAELQSGAAPTAMTLTGLLNEITALDRPLVLMMDDYHVIETASIHAALAFMIDHLPPRMHMIIAARSDPPLPLARLRARGELLELRAADLRFTNAELSTFLRGALTRTPEPDEVTALAERTEGWIAGVKLAALTLRGRQDVGSAIRSFSGDTRYVADYLIEEVLQGQPERTRRFLLATSILERLNASVCDAVTGQAGSQRELEDLEKRNLFVVPLDDRREWYRYHHLFADVLQRLAEREDMQHVRELHRRASEWYERNGASSAAVRHAQHAGDSDRMADLLEQHWPSRDRSYESCRWLERAKSLPQSAVTARPVLHMGFAWALLNAGELEAAELQLNELESVIDPERHQALAHEAATARVYLAQSRGDGARTEELARRAIELAPAGNHSAHATGFALLALAQWARGSLDAAHDTFGAALASMRLAGAELDALRGEFVLGDIRALQGRLREAKQIYEAGLERASRHPEAETDELYLGLAELLHEQGQLHDAERVLLEVEQKSQRAAHFANRSRWCIVMSRVAEARGEATRALQLLAEADTSLRRDPLPVSRPVDALRARIRIRQGDIAAAETWAAQQQLGTDDTLAFSREFDHLTLARLLMARADFAEAADLLDRLASAAEAGGRIGRLIEALTLHALALHRLGDPRASQGALARALDLAAPEHFVRVFADEGSPMRDLLRTAVARGIGGAYARSLLAAFDAPATASESPAESHGAPSPAGPLTSRELEILRLIAAGLRNQEIADQLFISPATVKRHIANVYNKLDATHRTDALRRATALNLL